jgi:hypothetical protein
MLRVVRNSHLWLPGFMSERHQRRLLAAKHGPPKRLWLLLADHFEPFWRGASADTARARVKIWRKLWPEIASRHYDSAGRPPRYTFFYPEEQYKPELLDLLAEIRELGVGDVEVHLHHDQDTETAFVDRLGRFLQELSLRHGLLQKDGDKLAYGFIHGNWALDNSRLDRRFCGLNNEITLLKKLGCYADFTLPAAPDTSQTRTVNTIYWAKDDPDRPRSHERGIPVVPGGGIEGDLMIIPGPLSFLVKGSGHLWPSLEVGELNAQEPATPARIQAWIRCSPCIGNDLFLKLFTHGAQEENAKMLLGGGLENCLRLLQETCRGAGISLYFVTAWEMRRVIDTLRERRSPEEIVFAPSCA